MFNSKMYALLALALGVTLAAPAQAGWNAWNAPPTTATASQQVTPAPGYEAYGRARYRGTPAPSRRPAMTGHTFHHPGH